MSRNVMSRKQKKVLARIIISALMTALLLFCRFSFEWYVELALWLLPYLVIGYDVLIKAFHGIIHGRLLDENFLMSVATVGAIFLAVWGRGDYLESVAVMLFYQLGEFFQSCAVGKSRKSISALMELRPDFARVERDGKYLEVSPEEVEVGEIEIIYPGERIAIDGCVADGESSLDTSALNGESMPRDVKVGDEVLSGSVNITAPLKMRTIRPYGESAVARILELVENASDHKSRPEKFISRFAKIYTPIICIAALLLALVPPVFALILSGRADFGEWIYRALSFLVISCPCALVISIPMGFFSALGGAGRRGILIKGSDSIELLSKLDCVALDKTGTLTEGRFNAVSINALGVSKELLLEYVAHAEATSSHPIARCVREIYGGEISQRRITDINEIRGKGVEAKVDGHLLRVGSAAFVSCDDEAGQNLTALYVSLDGEYVGNILFADTLRDNASRAVQRFENYGIRTVMLTGDNEKVGCAIAEQAGISDVRCGLLPEGKVCELESIMSETEGTVAFVGDGINDAPVLARADVGIAMGGIGTDAATDAADVIIMDDDPEKIADAVALSRKCMRIAVENIVFSIGVKFICLLLCALGIVGMNVAVFADVGVMVIAVLNSMRNLHQAYGAKSTEAKKYP